MEDQALGPEGTDEPRDGDEDAARGFDVSEGLPEPPAQYGPPTPSDEGAGSAHPDGFGYVVGRRSRRRRRESTAELPTLDFDTDELAIIRFEADVDTADFDDDSDSSTASGSEVVLADDEAVAVESSDGQEFPPHIGGPPLPDSIKAIRATIATIMAAAGLVTVLTGQDAFLAFVVLVAAMALFDLTFTLGSAIARPILPGALAMATAPPIAVSTAFNAAEGWMRVPGVLALGFMLSFMLILPFRRRGGVVDGLGSTVLTGLLVGLGAAALVALRALPVGGPQWVISLFVLFPVARLTGPVVGWIQRARHGREERSTDLDFEFRDPGPVQPVGLLGKTIAGTVLIASASLLLVLIVGGPLTPVDALWLGLIALVFAIGTERLDRALQLDTGRPRTPLLGSLWNSVDGVLLAAPVVYLLVTLVGRLV